MKSGNISKLPCIKKKILTKKCNIDIHRQSVMNLLVILKSLISPFLREDFFTCQTTKTLVTGICVFGEFENRFLSNFFGRLTFSRKNVNLPKQFELKWKC